MRANNPLALAYTHFGNAWAQFVPPLLEKETAMPVDEQTALKEAERLAELSDEALFHELGVRHEDAKRAGGDERKESFSAEFLAADATMSSSLLAQIGRNWWSDFEPQLMRWLCEQSNPDVQRITGGRSVPQLAAGLAVAGITALAVPPAWLIVATTLVATKISESGLRAVCKAWQDRRGQAPETPAGSEGKESS